MAEAIGRPREAMALPEVCEAAQPRHLRRRGQRRLGPFRPTPRASAASGATRPNSTPRCSTSPIGCASRCGSAGARRPTSSPSASAPPTMSATRSAPRAAEMCIQLLALDRALGDFFQALDRDRIDYRGGADRRSWRARSARAVAASRPAAAPARPAISIPRRSGAAIGRRLRLTGPAAVRRRPVRRHLYRDQPAGAHPHPRAQRSDRFLSPPSAGRRAVHPRPDRRRCRCRRRRPTAGV